ncbi:glycoside hydrolase family protein [Flammeovirga yaeyamensis]|uniref:Glycoside hydrolase family protein n=1 Tax=Flammeovirga yaeyamensis TaxID=367791 RepID=A0AAX1NB22_9BACT|nr:glycoside hydrolase family protein [Flammeovirga yaeyamensis]MBB3699865.1 hypothetical protein [Flammeovirga yaeyamensis]NMF38338.1 hypothetical protein [Flammeovirga yaeyamensis]QWG04749.1 glycoside hydrolase family protein [Flammeovirga yaeyamensis]
MKYTKRLIASLFFLGLIFGCSKPSSTQSNASASSDIDTDDLDLTKMIQPVGEENILKNDNFHNWGSSIVKGEDGKYHLFYAQMPKENSFFCWLTHGIISHAIADDPVGPYKHVEEVLAGRGADHWDAYTAHNPRIRYFDGKYYLYYMSTNTGDRKITSEELFEVGYHPKEHKELREILRRNQRIGVAVSESVFGPWERLDQPIVEPAGPIVNATSNSAVAKHPDGYYLMLFKGDKPDMGDKIFRQQAIATSPTPLGPWEVQPKLAVGDLNAEDPVIWYDDKRERFYGIYHAFGYMGLITSVDGFQWDKAKNYKVMDLSFDYKGKEKVDVKRLERPFVYIENGTPKVLTVAAKKSYLEGDSYSVFIPLKTEVQ